VAEPPKPADSGSSPTLDGFVAGVWAPRAGRRLAAKTRERDATIYRKHIRPALGDRPIADLDIEDLVVWQERLEEAGVGSPTLIKAIGILSTIFLEAERRPRSTGVKGNPAALLEKPSAKRRRRPLVWGPVVVERVRHELLVSSRRIGQERAPAAHRDALLVSLMEMTGCRPGEALALRWSDIGNRIAIVRRLSGTELVAGTKGGGERHVPVLRPLRADLAVLRELSGNRADDFLFRTSTGRHWVETDWRNYRSRHFVPALKCVEAGWQAWRRTLPDPSVVRENVTGLARTRPYDLGRHTHSALMLASGMSLQRLARIQGHGIRVLDDAYSEQLTEFEERNERIDPEREIEAARRLVACSTVDRTGT
jgi:integrase